MKIKFTTSFITISALSATLLLSGCGGSSSDSSTPTNTATTSATSGQFVDNYVMNVDYSCADGSHGVTDENGSFNCQSLPVTFSIGGLELGQISNLPTDKQVFPQDLLGLLRTDVNNTDVVAMAQFLQSCDEDQNPQNGIQIKSSIKEAFADTNETFHADDIHYYATEANTTLVSEDDAINHLESSVHFVKDVHDADIPTSIKSVLLTPDSTLSQATKDTLSYMGNEERLAHDVYLELYNYHVTAGNGEIKQLTNIATRSETTHIQTVQSLINKYDLNTSSFSNIDMTELGYKNTSVDDMTMGIYDIQKIQDLHDALIIKGEQSVQDALEVGCMVEVTDIDDLLTDIQTAKDSNASDVVTAFEFLRDGSYSHYWAFDKGLKNMGVTDGCCSLGEKYCHPEYPTNTKGADASSSDYDNEHGNRNGNGNANAQQNNETDMNQEPRRNQGEDHSQNGSGQQRGRE
jgi:hypothetical protein